MNRAPKLALAVRCVGCLSMTEDLKCWNQYHKKYYESDVLEVT